MSTALGPPSQQVAFDELYELLHSATRQRPAYEQLYRQAVYAKMVQETPKLHFNIEKIPRERRLDSADEKASQRKHEYVLIARFRAGAHADRSGAQIRRSITCTLANRILEPFFVHPAVRSRARMRSMWLGFVHSQALTVSTTCHSRTLLLLLQQDDLRQMKKTDRARVDELVLQGGRRLQNWTVQEQLYRVKLVLNPDEFFAISPLPALDNDTNALLTLDAP
jgi:hypothetical protein